VLAAEDGGTALEIAKSHPGAIDVLLCDVAMPGQSGPEVAHNVQAVRSDIRVLFVSGYPEGEDGVISSHGFLQKPYTRAILGEKLASLCSRGGAGPST
jgi:CheY-like chemotaxis protein